MRFSPSSIEEMPKHEDRVISDSSLSGAHSTVERNATLVTATTIAPLKDRRWDAFVGRHPRASIFHSSAWLQALFRTYGYEPVAYTTSAEDQDLENAIVFCRIDSWLTGRRLVSLPFSDHCEALIDTKQDLQPYAVALIRDAQREGCLYVETRPINQFDLSMSLERCITQYRFHELNLEDDLQTIFRNFHKDSIQRKIRRAQRERLVYKEGSTESLLDIFYKLFTSTRKRYSLPPPPREWFTNLMEGFGAALKIRVAFLNNQPVAAIITIRHKNTLVYKYGASDPRFTNLGSMHLLFWTSIQEAKDWKLGSFDLGRCDLHQQGLAIFKNRWGATQSTFSYSRYGFSRNLQHVLDLSSDWKSRTAKLVIAYLRPSLLSSIGGALYRHAG
jgi:hypothetical protein